MLHKVRARLRRLPLASALAISFVAGIIIWGGFNTAIEATNTQSFCISCHEMRDNVYQEFKTSPHYANASGVRASCPDCHVPKTWGYKVLRKIRATNELLHHFAGSIDTPEKFEAHRLELAEIVWNTMQSTDSRECRNCHNEEFMDLDDQEEIAREQHRRAHDEHKTCIDCHKGISHQLPEGVLDQEHERFERDEIPCWACHEDMPKPDTDEDWGWD